MTSSLRRCLSALLGADVPEDMWDIASLPLSVGGIGLRGAVRSRPAAYWSSWADSLEMIQQRHEPVCAQILHILTRGGGSFHVEGAVRARQDLQRMGFDAPEWLPLAHGLRPRSQDRDDDGLGMPSHGWQHDASGKVTDDLMNRVWPRLSEPSRALLRSQGGPMSGVPFSCCPVSPTSRFSSQEFRVLLLRRLWLPLPLSVHSCRCGRPLDAFGHHHAACATVGVLGRRGFSLESGAARVCREAGGRVSVNVFVRDLDIAILGVLDNRRLEVVADGLPLFHGAQLAVDTTMVSPLKRDGPAFPRATVDGAALAWQRKDSTYPELAGRFGRSRLVVLACEVGGRLSEECQDFLRQLAKAKVRGLPIVTRSRARQAWLWRWSCLLACSAARAFALSLLERRVAFWSDGPTPSSAEVEVDARYVSLSPVE